MDKEVVSKLVFSIVQFLRSQLEASGSSDILSEEGAESVEVALQCLETAYGITSESLHLGVSRSLYDIFKDVAAVPQSVNRPTFGTPTSPEDREEAESLKNQGNALMRDEKFSEALACYTQAITKDRTNAVYYCNRAAAHSKLTNHSGAINDCKLALSIEPNYSKAYGRMGLAYSAINNAREAKRCYEKALELEPDNESYRGNLQIAEEKLKSESTGSEQSSSSANQAAFNPFAALGGGGLLGNLGGLGGSGGGPADVQSLFTNPALMNMATQLMQDPNIQNMMTSFLGGAGGPPGPAPAPAAPAPAPQPVSSEAPPTISPEGAPGGANSMEALLTAGRQLAEQMQARHPDLVEQLRTTMNRGNPDGSNEDPPAS